MKIQRLFILKQTKTKKTHSRYVGLHGVTQRLMNHRERESETMAKGEETGKSHLIVWNKNEPPSVLCSSAQWKPHFPIKMLTDCAVNHANESQTAPGLIFAVPLESRRSSSATWVADVLGCHCRVWVQLCILWGTSSLRSFFLSGSGDHERLDPECP